MILVSWLQITKCTSHHTMLICNYKMLNLHCAKIQASKTFIDTNNTWPKVLKYSLNGLSSTKPVGNNIVNGRSSVKYTCLLAVQWMPEVSDQQPPWLNSRLPQCCSLWYPNSRLEALPWLTSNYQRHGVWAWNVMNYEDWYWNIKLIPVNISHTVYV